MDVHSTDGDTLIHEIMRLAGEAVQFHGKMAGSVVFPESFIRDWVAIELHRHYKLGVTIETGRSDVLRFLVDEDQWQAHDILKLGNYRLDMIVWEEPDRPLAVVEFKRSPLVSDDVRRTASILSVAREKGLIGCAIACIALSQQKEFENRKAALVSATKDLRVGDVQSHGPLMVRNVGEGEIGWCGVFAIRARPSLSPTQ